MTTAADTQHFHIQIVQLGKWKVSRCRQTVYMYIGDLYAFIAVNVPKFPVEMEMDDVFSRDRLKIGRRSMIISLQKKRFFYLQSK